MCYTCINGCDFHMHEECLNAKPVANHFLYGERTFYLQSQESPTDSDTCNTCWRTVKGLRYWHRTDKGDYIFLHPCCIQLPSSYNTNGTTSHILKRMLTSAECKQCKRTGEVGVNGCGYLSTRQSLPSLHVKCMQELEYEMDEDLRTRAQQYHAPQSSQAMTTTTPTPAERKRPVFGKATRASADLLFSLATGDVFTAVSTIYDML